ncbi:MAG: hypothetical protein GY711_13410 [bacterium]|nr:hypothetical protein [bacterium]
MSTLRRQGPAEAQQRAYTERSSTVHRPGTRDEAGEPVVELRVVGPGRKERSYRERIASLYLELDERSAELETAHLVERGTGRLIDRVEAELDRERHQQKRLLVALGGLQRENEQLAEELNRARARLARLDAPRERRGLFARLFGARS